MSIVKARGFLMRDIILYNITKSTTGKIGTTALGRDQK